MIDLNLLNEAERGLLKQLHKEQIEYLMAEAVVQGWNANMIQTVLNILLKPVGAQAEVSGQQQATDGQHRHNPNRFNRKTK